MILKAPFAIKADFLAAPILQETSTLSSGFFPVYLYLYNYSPFQKNGQNIFKAYSGYRFGHDFQPTALKELHFVF